MSERTDAGDAGELVRACAAGDAAARRQFQERFGEEIYNFPMKVHRLAPEMAADFYLYVFEQDRVFSRLEGFEGRGGVQLRTYLVYHVLRSLLLDWLRTRRELDTVSLATPVGAEGDLLLEDVLAAPEVEPAAVAAGEQSAVLWQSLEPEERLDLELLCLLEHDLGPAELRLLAELSGRPLDETMDLVEEVRSALWRRDARLAELGDELDSAWGWLVLRRRELQEVSEKIRLLEQQPDSPEHRRLDARRAELERAIEKRSAQHARILEQVRGYKMTTSYKDIARLKGSTVGTVCSRIFRLRQRLEKLAGGGEGAS